MIHGSPSILRVIREMPDTCMRTPLAMIVSKRRPFEALALNQLDHFGISTRHSQHSSQLAADGERW